MSLKAFHLVFVTCMTLLTFGCGVWLLSQYKASPEDHKNFLTLGCLSLAAGVAVIFYGKYFLKKLKNESYL